MRSPSRRTGPMPIVSTAGSREPTRTPTPSVHSPGSSASPPGCGATPTSSTSSAGFEPTTTRAERPTGFYGLDLYSLYRSMAAVVRVPRRDRPAGRGAGRASATRASSGSEREPGLRVCGGPRARRPPAARASFASSSTCSATGEMYLRRDGIAAEDEQFYAEQNARLVVARRAATTGRCSADRCRRGTFATATWLGRSSG